MIIVEVMGGLGNQMQQYALYRKLESLGKDARLMFPGFSTKSGRQRCLQAGSWSCPGLKIFLQNIVHREEKAGNSWKKYFGRKTEKEAA